MAFHDMLLQIAAYPEPTPQALITEGVALGAKLGDGLSALAVCVRIPVHSNRIADYLIRLSDLAEEEEARSAAAARSALDRFTEAARTAGVFRDGLLESADLYAVAEHVAGRARTRDLCIVPLAERFDGQRETAQAIIFGSGRPVLLFAAGRSGPEGPLGTAVVAWDGGACSARALAASLPALKRAEKVRVVGVLNDKPAAGPGVTAEPVRHLKAHGIDAVGEEIDGGGAPAGRLIEDYVQTHGASLLIMGAYGHSRLRDFVLGGATEHVLRNPPVPVLLTH